MLRHIITSFILVISVFTVCNLTGSTAHAHKTSLLAALRMTGDMTICGEKVPMDDPEVRERFEKEMLLSLGDGPQVVLWLKRAPRYFPVIERQLKSRGMPNDLKYLAVAESALRPHAGSAKGAVGFWQLMPQTARKYGLTVDRFIDERRNLYLSTTAALDYLNVLNKKFSSWTLALAGYNMGEEGLAAEVMEQNTKNFYYLYLPLETQRFLLRILCIKLILSQPERYGFDIKAKERYKPLAFETVGVDCSEQLPIQIIAQASLTVFKSIKDLNPHLRGHHMQPGRYQINVPVGTAKGFKKRLKNLVAQYNRTRRRSVYVVRSGDNLTRIAEQFNIPLASILIWNRLDLKRSIHPGDRLIIYPRRLSDVK